MSDAVSGSGPSGRAEFDVETPAISGRLHLADGRGPQPAIVLVGETGSGSERDWDGWLAPLVEHGSAVLTFETRESGDGDWRNRTLEAQAAATRAAIDAVRNQPEVDSERVGLLGVSQGGWVAALAAASAAEEGDPNEICAVVTVSGSGVTVAEQERYRITRQLPEEGFSVMETQLARSLLDRRIARLAGGHPVEAVFADERAYASDRWFRTLAAESPDELAYLAHVYAFDPAPVLERVPCPVLGVFGGEDATVPVFESVKRYLESLRGREPDSQVVIVPGADHDLRVTRDGVTERPAMVVETIADWLGRALSAERPC